MCSVSKYKVKWHIDENFIKDIKTSLKKDKDEKAGVLLFTDINCKDGLCDKKSTEYKLSNGDGSSVYTPNGIINFHTHPKSAYMSENAVFGWPSGEDMSVCIELAKKDNLIHIVFTLEGAYVIKVNKILTTKDSKILEELLKDTHVFRSSNQATQLKNFKKIFGVNGAKTKDIWLNLVNSLTLNKLYILYNLINDKNLKVPNNNEQIFEVKLVPINKTLIFEANYIEENCHRMNFKHGSKF